MSVENQKFAEYILSSFPRKRESSRFENKWIPARARSAGLAGMTTIYAMNLRYGTLVLEATNVTANVPRGVQAAFIGRC